MLESVAFYWLLIGSLLILAGVLLYYTGWYQKIFPVVIIDSQEAWVVDRWGKDRVLYEGFNRILPGVDKIEAKVSLKEFPIDPPEQSIITKDQIKISVDMIATIKVIDPMKAIMEIDDYKEAVKSLVMTSVLSKMGKQDLAEIQQNVDGISKEVIAHVEEESSRWGVKVIQVRFENIDYSDEIKATMENEVAERIKNKMRIEEAQAQSDAAVTEAEGLKKAAAFKADALVHE
ncbi:MAG: SPFH/Band 7/PHB domain protein, partial [Sulfurovaceae bacterium]|nr:SPFH/Band 7/PHB domain protein [Sulfurovaceae bacterium]